MFPHVVTIYHHEVKDGKDIYPFEVVDGAYWNRKVKVAMSGKGQDEGGETKVVFSPSQTALYGSIWHVKPNDRIVLGEHGGITSWKEIDSFAMVVKAVEENICGSSVDNITAVG